MDGKIEPDALSKAEGMLESELLDLGSSGTLGGIVKTYVLMLFDSSALEATKEALKAVNRVTPWTLNSEQQQPDVYEDECIKAHQSVQVERSLFLTLLVCSLDFTVQTFDTN
jgi:hypothetical protein